MTSLSVLTPHSHLQLLDGLLQTLPGEESAPAPEFPVSDPPEPPDDEPPGDEGEGHDGEHPVKQSRQSHSPGTRLRVRG